MPATKAPDLPQGSVGTTAEVLCRSILSSGVRTAQPPGLKPGCAVYTYVGTAAIYVLAALGTAQGAARLAACNAWLCTLLRLLTVGWLWSKAKL